MLGAAGRRLADRIAAGTAELVVGKAAALPFGDGTFSACAAIYAPASAVEVFRVLRPGGRFVIADPQPARAPADSAVAYGVGRSRSGANGNPKRAWLQGRGLVPLTTIASPS